MQPEPLQSVELEDGEIRVTTEDAVDDDALPGAMSAPAVASTSDEVHADGLLFSVHNFYEQCVWFRASRDGRPMRISLQR